jgi:hypothetical protein
MKRSNSRLLVRAMGLLVLTPALQGGQVAVALADEQPPGASANAAEQLGELAFRQHAAGQFAEAIATYLKAYEISRAPAVLYNIATIYDRKLHERELAAEYLRRYLAAPDADPDLTQKAAARLTALKKEIADDEQARANARLAVLPVAPAAAPSTPPPEGLPPPALATVAPKDEHRAASPVRTTGIVVGSAGIAAIGTSLVLGAVAQHENSNANAVCNGAVCTKQSGVDAASEAGTLATAATATFIGGVVLAALGVTLYVVSPKKTTPALTIAPMMGAGTAGLGLGGAFQ